MRELYPDPEKDWKPKVQRFLLETDSRFDDFMFQAGRWSRELYERFSMFMDRFHIGGWRRWTFIEPLSEGATMGARAASSCCSRSRSRRSARPRTTTG